MVLLCRRLFGTILWLTTGQRRRAWVAVDFSPLLPLEVTPEGSHRVAGLSSLPGPLPPTTAQPLRRSRPRIGQFPFSPFPTRRAPLEANRLGLALDVREEDVAVLLPQPDLDEGPEDDLDADRELEGGRRLPRQDPRPVQNVFSNITTSCRRLTPDGTPARYSLYIYYLIYNL